MEKEKFAAHCLQIVELVEGMTEAQWSKVTHLINRCYEEKQTKVTFEKPENLDLLMRQHFIL